MFEELSAYKSYPRYKEMVDLINGHCITNCISFASSSSFFFPRSHEVPRNTSSSSLSWSFCMKEESSADPTRRIKKARVQTDDLKSSPSAVQMRLWNMQWFGRDRQRDSRGSIRSSRRRRRSRYYAVCMFLFLGWIFNVSPDGLTFRSWTTGLILATLGFLYG